MPSSRVPRTPGSVLVPVVKQRLQQEWQIKLGQQKAEAAKASKLKAALLVRLKVLSIGHYCSVLLFRGRIALGSAMPWTGMSFTVHSWSLQAAEGEVVFGLLVLGIFSLCLSIPSMK